MTAAPVQTLASGSLISARYGRFGTAGFRTRAAPNRLFGMIVGKSNAGKTHFFASHPGALIINTDLSSTPYPGSTPAQFFPAVDEGGQSLDSSGHPFVLSWQHCLDLQKSLCDASRTNLPRPEIIVIDSLTTTVRLLKAHIVKAADKSDWRELHGQTAWDTLYDSIIEYAQTLRAHGYGVWYTCHLTDKIIPIDENRHEKRLDLAGITDNFYRRFNCLLEFCAAIESRTITESVTSNREVEVQGKKILVPKVETRTVRKRIMQFDSPDLTGILKTRVKLPAEVELPELDGWSFFDTLYRTSQEPPSSKE